MDNYVPGILVVDDEIDTCRNLADILEDYGFRVDVAHDGYSALELFGSHAYDIAVLDLRMPGMDGLTLYREIKKLSSGTLAIFVTAYAVKSTATAALTAGVLDVFPKPVEFPKLMDVMKQILERPLALLVDDDEDLCANLWDLLTDHGYRVDVAHSETDAAARLQSRNYHVVLIDIKLPQGDGRGVFAKVREAIPEAPVIAITGYREETQAIIDAIIASTGTAVCYKPFNIPELLATLERLAPLSKQN